MLVRRYFVVASWPHYRLLATSSFGPPAWHSQVARKSKSRATQCRGQARLSIASNFGWDVEPLLRTLSEKKGNIESQKQGRMNNSRNMQNFMGNAMLVLGILLHAPVISSRLYNSSSPRFINLARGEDAFIVTWSTSQMTEVVRSTI